MTKGNGLAEFDKALREHPPQINEGVRLGEGLFRALQSNGRITTEQWHATGLPSAGEMLPTLDKRYYVDCNPLMADDGFELK